MPLLKTTRRTEKQTRNDAKGYSKERGNERQYNNQWETSALQRGTVDDRVDFSIQRTPGAFTIASDSSWNQEQQRQIQHEDMLSKSAQSVRRKPVGSGQHSRNHEEQYNNRITDDSIASGSRRAMDDTISRSSRRRRRRTASSRHRHDAERLTQSRSSISTETEPARWRPRSDLWSWIDYLPQSADDKSIVDNVQQVFVLAEQYVNNFYVDRRGQQAQFMAHFERQGINNLPVDIEIKELMYSVAHPTILIKHSLVATLLDIISLEGCGRWTSLLPVEFTSLTRAIRNSKATETETPHLNAALSAHRVLSHFIRRHVTRDASYVKKRDDSISKVVEDIEVAFAPWENRDRTRDQRGPILTGLLQQAADLGLLLFSQASTFLFDWVLKPTTSDAIDVAISPRLFKVYDENAQIIDTPQQMTRIKTERTFIEVPLLRSSKTVAANPLGHGEAGKAVRTDSSSTLAIDAVYSDIAELPANGSGTSKLSHSVSSDTCVCQPSNLRPLEKHLETSATTLGPPPNEPDFENANGEGISLSFPWDTAEADIVNGLGQTTILKPSDDHQDIGTSSFPQSFIDTVQYLPHKYNEFAIHDRRRFSHNQIIEKLRYVAPTQQEKSPSTRQPPTSFRLDFTTKPLGRTGSVDRGRDPSRSSLLRNRSCSESRIPRESFKQRLMAQSPEEDIIRARIEPGSVIQQYIDRRSATSRAREDRVPTAAALHAIPDGSIHPTSPATNTDAATNASNAHHMSFVNQQAQKIPNLNQALLIPPTREAVQDPRMMNQSSVKSGWFKAIRAVVRGDPERYKQSVLSM